MKPLLILSAISLACVALANDPPHSRRLPAVKFSKAPVIDGDLSDAVWAEAAKAEQFVDPFTGTAAQDPTEVLMGYDDEAIYIAFMCHDSNPDQILAREIRSGVEFVGEDYVVIRMDPFFTRQDGQVDRFLINAIGTKSEFLTAGRAAKREWRGIWEAKTKRLPNGWSVEVKLPWKMLSYPNSGANGINMSINFGRYYARPKNRELWSDITAVFRADRDGIWEGVKPPRTSAPKVQYLGYGLAKNTDDGTKFDAGLDIRYPITPQMTVVGSINPDFENVEQQIETIQFTRDERFLGDSRPFFAEGSAFTNTTHAQGIGRVFYSRRIEDFDLGAKVFGKANPELSLGAMTTTEFDGDTNAVFHLRKQSGKNTRLTLFNVTHDGEERQNSTTGAGLLQRFGNYYLYGETAREKDSNYSSEANSFSLIYQVPNWVLDYRYTDLAPDFNPALGLIPFKNRRGYYFAGAYSNNYSNKYIKDVFYRFEYTDFDQTDSGDRYIDGYDVQASMITKDNQQFFVQFENRSFFGQLDRLHTAIYGIDVNNRSNYTYFTYTWGERGGQDYRFFSFDTVKRLVGKLDVGFIWNSEEFIEKNDQYIASIGWEFDGQRALTGHYVKSPFGTNYFASFRNGGGAGRELYIILGDPNATKFERKLTLKTVWPF